MRLPLFTTATFAFGDLFKLAMSRYLDGKEVAWVAEMGLNLRARGIVLVLMLLIAWWISRRWQVSVVADGLRRRFAFGRWREIRWEEIQDVKPVPLLGAIEVEVQNKAYFIPLAPEPREEFLKLLARHAGQTHPVYQAVASPSAKVVVE